MDIIRWCNRIIKYSYYLLFILVPLILTPWNYELFEFNKMIVTYGLTVVIVTAWIVKMAAQKRISVRRTPLDIPLILFVISQLISSLFSMDPHVSWFGYYSRFNGGMLSVFCYVLLYYAFVSNWHTDQDQDKVEHSGKNSSQPAPITTFLYIILGTGVAVSIYGILEHFGIDKNMWVQDVQNRVFSTLGQPNWLAAYLVAIIPISLTFALQQFFAKAKQLSPTRLLLFGSIYLLYVVTLIFTKSRSGIAAYGITVFLYFIGTIILNKANWKKITVAFIGLHLIVLLFVSYYGSSIDQIDKYIKFDSIMSHLSPQKQPATPKQPAPAAAQPSGTLLEYGGTESGTIRKYVWQAAITAWRSTMKTFFIGTGTETFAFAFFQFKPVGHNLTSEWDFLYNKAHNEYLNYLATTGIFGFGAYALVLGMFIVWAVNKGKALVSSVSSEGKSHTDEQATSIVTRQLSLALFAGWISILITNFFGFSVVIIQLLFFLIPAIIISLYQTKQIFLVTFTLPKKAAVGLAGTIFFVGSIAFCYVGVMWFGDYYFSAGYRLSRSGKLADAYENLTQATFFRPREPLYLDELGVVLGGLSVASLQAGNATAASQLAQQSLAANDLSLQISPNNVNFWKTRTKIYFGFSELDNKFVEAAKEALEKASSLSPNDPKITYNLAVLEGRLGNNDKAIEILKHTIDLKPNYRDAYFALSVFYEETKQPALAKQILQAYLTKVDPNDKEFNEKVKTE